MTLSGGSGVGNAVYQTNATSGNATFSIEMGSSQECVIHNLYWSGACTIQVYDGTNAEIFFTAPSGAGSLNNCQFHVVASSYYIRMVDTSGSTNNMAVDGIRTV
jgi:hypothetical protein